MLAAEFTLLRKRLEKTQQQIARLLGVSQKTVQSYEQGWRSIPDHVARLMLLLVTGQNNNNDGSRPCWDLVDCPAEKKESCPAWEFQQGHMCWFLNDTACDQGAFKSWREKIEHCRQCRVLLNALG